MKLLLASVLECGERNAGFTKNVGKINFVPGTESFREQIRVAIQGVAK